MKDLQVLNGLITKTQAIDFASHLSSLSCVDVILFQLTGYFDYADFAILASTSSEVHRRGVVDDIPLYLNSKGLHASAKLCVNRSQANNMGEWILLDLNDIIVHLMSTEYRTFYELERLWFETEVLLDTRSETKD